MVADFQAKLSEEKEEERLRREQFREEARARREYEQERARLEARLAKERSHWQNILARGLVSEEGRAAMEAQAEAKIAEIEGAIAGIDAREANIRAGYIYVISNLGACGDGMVKIGLTRRLDPMDRIYELGDASVPFRFDVHALVFSEDAVGLENHLHQALAHVRVNLVNRRREFFYATPSEVRALLRQRAEAGHMLEFIEEALAPEFRQSEGERRRVGSPD